MWLRVYASGAKFFFVFPSLSLPRGFPFFALLKSAFNSSLWAWRRKKVWKDLRWQKHELITCGRKPTFKSSIFSFSLVIWDSCDFDTLRWWLQIMATWAYKEWQSSVMKSDDTSTCFYPFEEQVIPLCWLADIQQFFQEEFHLLFPCATIMIAKRHMFSS